MRIVNKTGESKWISEYEAHTLSTKNVGEHNTSQNTFFKTKKFVIFKEGKTESFSNALLIRRLAAVIAKNTNSLVQISNDTLITTKSGKVNKSSEFYKVCDQINTKQEMDWHRNKAKGNFPAHHFKLVSLRPSKHAPHFSIDNQTIKDYYDTFSFGWFAPFLKQKAFKAITTTNKWVFIKRRLNTTSKTTSEQKFRKAFSKHDIAKTYFSGNRMLDSAKEPVGEGHPLNLLYAVLDIDGTHNTDCLVTPKGTCAKCMKNANKKLKKVLLRLSTKPFKVLFSGVQGFHVHPYDHEITEQTYLTLLNHVNTQEQLVDDFSFLDKKSGEQQWDSHRIWKVPHTIDATTTCKITELPIQKLKVKDKILQPQ